MKKSKKAVIVIYEMKEIVYNIAGKRRNVEENLQNEA